MSNRLVNSNHNYADLLCYKKAVVIYDLTHHFCTRFISEHDRTFDQMIQAARSGKQNIVEGTVDKATSYEMAIKLINVARGSLKELLEDYKDYLRVHRLQLWPLDSREVEAMRKLGKEQSDPSHYVTLAESRSAEVVANMVIVLLYQADTLLMRYIASVEEEFRLEGGVKERMYAVRMSVKNGK